MEILPRNLPDEPEVEAPSVEQPETYADIALLDSASIQATFDALTNPQGAEESAETVDEEPMGE